MSPKGATGVRDRGSTNDIQERATEYTEATERHRAASVVCSSLNADGGPPRLAPPI
jgi:hypothetical protein